MSGSGPGPTVTVDRPEPRGARCPRCETPIAGDYKFCPTCAFRLRSSTLDPAPAAPPSPPRKGRLLLAGLAGALLVVAIVVVGFALDRPEWPQHPTPFTSQPPLDRAYTVADIPGQLISLESNGYAYSVPLSAVQGLSDERRAEIEETLRANGRVLTDEPSLDAIIPYRLQILRIEITRGQYEEFLRDIEEHRDRIPEVWLEWDTKPSVLDIDVLSHVPPSWIRASDPSSPEWGVDESEKNLPVAQVSYVDAVGFCQWASQRLHIEIKLPFMMEWVRAARHPPTASTTSDEVISSAWPWGAMNIRRTYACNSLSFSLPNPGQPRIVDFTYSEGNGGATVDGVLAMAGNVREWAVKHDVRLDGENRPLGQPPYLTWETTPETRRDPAAYAYGGSFKTGIDDCQVDSHAEYKKTDRRDDLGFRVVAR